MQQQYTISHIANIIGGELLGNTQHHVAIQDIITDSRQQLVSQKNIFFALVSKRNDGHNYVEALYEKGVRYFVVSAYRPNWDKFSEARFIRVNDTLEALQTLSVWHRNQFEIPVVGITGSNGKTVVKEWLFQILEPDFQIVRSPKSYNSQLGVPLSVWQMKTSNRLAIFEAGISMPGEMQKLQKIIRPTIGLITNIGTAHGENFSKVEQKIDEKLKLFKESEKLVYCFDDKRIHSGIQRADFLKNTQLFTWSKQSKAANLYIRSQQVSSQQTTIEAIYKQKTIQITIPFTDEASIENAIHCWSIALLLGVSEQAIAERMKNLTGIAMRLELKAGINNCTIIDDSYNSDINSLAIALDFMNQQQQHKYKTLILSDMLQNENNESALYNHIARLVSAKGVDFIIGIGESIGKYSDYFAVKKLFYQNTESFLSEFQIESLHDQTILLKGSRVFEFERISSLLQEKAHETVLEINLNSLVHNLNYYRSKINTETKLMVLVKAFGYGSGGFEIANVLQFHHADYLTVAYADEGIELRQAGIKLPIMVMNPEESALEAMIYNQLEPEIFSFRILEKLEQTLSQIASIEQPIKIHLKLDTGMHRLGFDENQIDLLINRVKANPMLHVQSVFSHLAASDNPEHDTFTKTQIALFERLSKKIVQSFSYPVMRHILNTGGISRFAEAQYEMVRLGIGLYGVAPIPSDKNYLETVVSLKSTLSQIKKIDTNESVGYNRQSYTKRASVIGVVPIGYADGLPRSLGNGKGTLWVNNMPAPIIGNICMDMCMIDLTGIEAKEGDLVIVFNKTHPIEAIAEASETIPYEILTRISRRVKRVYFQE
ncbi:MAG: bifunctional UDP-N-acetylmuramoyl-tripeptide:D-alanyl-D-alanine ligase/alanine racemase [Lentimicrobiaceae bacterium]|jgi:alanine racemase|nr:bifunctional UDP-N-acetylmuramoyl-tripeptide:D-alanyl-D-alanine ligase/alanine racemase [Lentimicrobiaceae bacterium]